MTYLQVSPPMLTAENMQAITSIGCSIPAGSVIMADTQDRVESVWYYLVEAGFQVELVNPPFPGPCFTDRERAILAATWLADQL